MPARYPDRARCAFLRAEMWISCTEDLITIDLIERAVIGR